MPKETNNTKKLTLFALTWPIFIEIFLHMLMGSADTLMLSQYSDEGVAAVGVANQVLSLIVVMFGFIAVGTSVLIAQYIGARQEQEAGRIAVVSLVANFAFALLLSIGIALFSSPILKLMNIPAELMEPAMVYLIIVGGFSFVQALLMTAGAIIKSHGFTKDAMYVTIGMNVLNVIGNYLVLFGPFGFPVLGVTGVAISTTVSRGIGLIILMVILYKRVNGDLPFSFLRKYPKKQLGDLLKIGVPSAGEHISYNSSQLMITFFIAMLGTEALTTKVYAQNLMMFISLFSIAVSQSTQILIGHQVGAGKIKEAYQRCIKSLNIAILISLVMAGVFSLFREDLLRIFTSNSDIIALGSILILLTIILEPGRAFNLVVINSLRAAGDVRFPVYMGILSMWGVAVPLSYILGIHFGLGLIGVWIAFIADEWLRGVIMLLRWKGKKWQNMAFVSKKDRQTA
ncbi:MATE family efflux transporter [Alkalihalobacillus sp. LMS39]|uniref:MATE family efflux transporter n=1 Tax=Alkalihalobacillus sp. LMS39 TaxID=2924032 RepID=UPI001FB51030|nr:MATE family efflux transporter [Alkalihalobacillus sp. LMS39]UOE93229.1 MATE family efflux transporter [Alkalihalobacillus sp. LMS39]